MDMGVDQARADERTLQIDHLQPLCLSSVQVVRLALVDGLDDALDDLDGPLPRQKLTGSGVDHLGVNEKEAFGDGQRPGLEGELGETGRDHDVGCQSRWTTGSCALAV